MRSDYTKFSREHCYGAVLVEWWLPIWLGNAMFLSHLRWNPWRERLGKGYQILLVLFGAHVGDIKCFIGCGFSFSGGKLMTFLQCRGHAVEGAIG